VTAAFGGLRVFSHELRKFSAIPYERAASTYRMPDA